MSNTNTTTQQIELELSNGKLLTFTVTAKKYIKYINAMQAKDKYNPAYNFLISVVDDECKDDLRPLMANPATTLELLGEVIEDYGSEVSVVTKKQKTAPSK
jgi:hypothetical protein